MAARRSKTRAHARAHAREAWLALVFDALHPERKRVEERQGRLYDEQTAESLEFIRGLNPKQREIYREFLHKLNE